MFTPRSTGIAPLTLSVVLSAAMLSTAWADEPLLERDILPILTKSCMGCHGGLVSEGGLDLRTLPAMLAGGDSGPAIASGRADDSGLWERILSDEMPAGDDREKLSAADKGAIKAWIDAGLPTVSQRQENVDPLLSGDESHEVPEVAAAIDQHIGRFLDTARLQPAPLTDDEEFLRRIYVDLAGRVPTAEQAVAFLDGRQPDRREQLIDALLETPEFGEQFGRTWRDWVCPPELPSDDNGGGQPYPQARAFGSWIGKKVVAGERWDQITREILTVQGAIEKNPQVIFFALVGQGGKTTADGSARAVASLFMGVQLQCARCHDDPYRDWSQQEHWGLAAFFGRSEGDFKKVEIDKGPSKKPGEIKIPDSAFRNTGSIVQAALLRGDRFEAKGDEDLRQPFVDWLTARDNPYFGRAFVNRVWFSLFSRGIVNPIDDFRELNPPAHPGLLKLLTGEFTASGYDIKHLIRCICNSRTYQRASRVAPDMGDLQRTALTTAFGRMPLRLMTADQLYDSLKLAYGNPSLDLRTNVKHATVGGAAPVGDVWLEFQRRFGTNEEDATDFTHGIAQMLTMINHPRLLSGGHSLERFRKKTPDAAPEQTIEWLYLSTLSRRPTEEELVEATEFVSQSSDSAAAFNGVLWMLVNRSEFLLVR